MKTAVGLVVALSAIALVTPVTAQIVNGNQGGNRTSEAPIGTKAGGSSASMQAPGEAAAAAGAAQNNAEAKNMGPITSSTEKRVRHKSANTSP